MTTTPTVDAGPATDVSAREEDASTLGVQAVLWGYPMACCARASGAGVRGGASHVPLAKGALGAQLANEVLCPACDVDADGEPLHGRHEYELHFPPGELPPVSRFWSMSLFGEDLMFVENDAGRYSIGNTTDGLASNPDGSLTLSIKQNRPDDQLAQANWLPAPDGPFNLTMRFYGPATSVLDGTYRLPAVAKRQ